MFILSKQRQRRIPEIHLSKSPDTSKSMWRIIHALEDQSSVFHGFLSAIADQLQSLPNSPHNKHNMEFVKMF